MKQEEKSLLFKELCSRLPYGVYCDVDGETKLLYSISGDSVGFVKNIAAMMVHCVTINSVKPYLRPMSSMTDAEKSKLESFGFMYENGYITNEDANEYNDYRQHPYTWVDEVKCSEVIDFLNSHHFDSRGLIEKGLALEAPEGIYKKYYD